MTAEPEMYLFGSIDLIGNIMANHRPRPFRVTSTVIRVDEISGAMLILQYDSLLTRVYATGNK